MGTPIALESADVTETATAFTGKGTLYAVSLDTGDAVIFDNTTNSGRVLGNFVQPGLNFGGHGVPFAIGLHVVVTTAAHVTVYFTRGA